MHVAFVNIGCAMIENTYIQFRMMTIGQFASYTFWELGFWAELYRRKFVFNKEQYSSSSAYLRQHTVTSKHHITRYIQFSINYTIMCPCFSNTYDIRLHSINCCLEYIQFIN